MTVDLSLSDGKSRLHEVSDETFEQMKSDFGSDDRKVYDILPDGKVVVDWNKVIAINRLEPIDHTGFHMFEMVSPRRGRR